jgi:hypothetical protein
VPELFGTAAALLREMLGAAPKTFGALAVLLEA